MSGSLRSFRYRYLLDGLGEEGERIPDGLKVKLDGLWATVTLNGD